MLGWEFPPLFSGGLGIATHGLVKELSNSVKISLIVPTTSEAMKVDNVNFIGLNRITLNDIALEREQFDLLLCHTELFEIPIPVSPYHWINKSVIVAEQYARKLSTEEGNEEKEAIHQIFSGNEIYGLNILSKVHLYAKLSEQIASRRNFDVIHAHDWVTSQAGVNIKQRTGKLFILHIHSLETDRSGHSARNAIYQLERTGMEEADKIIAVSQFTKDQIIEHYQIDPQKIDVVHNGIDPAETKRQSHPMKDKLVVFLGRLTNQKGPQFLIDTAEKVAAIYPRVKFVVAGTGDEFANSLETSAFKRLGNKFIFTGFLSKKQVNDLLSMADVYFMPSVSEPFGLTALEAIQYKVPSVISLQSGAAEVINSSLKADFWDTDKYANYIVALLKYQVLSQVLSNRALDELESLTWSHAARKVQDIYQGLLEAKINH